MRKFTNMGKSRIERLAFSPEGTTLACVMKGALAFGLWEWPGGKFRRHNPWIDGPVSTLAYSPDGKWLVVGGKVGLALPYIRAEDNYDSEMHASRAIGGLAFSSRVVRGHTVVAIGGDRVRLYDLDAPYGDKKLLWDEELPSQEGWFRSLSFHPTKDILVGCDADRDVLFIWNPVTRKLRRTPNVFTLETAVAFSPSGHRLATAYEGHTFIIDTTKWGGVGVGEHDDGVITDLAASPDGRWFATSGTDGTVRLWDATTGSAGRVYDWGVGEISAVTFAPDGLTCAAGGENGQVVVWDVDA